MNKKLKIKIIPQLFMKYLQTFETYTNMNYPDLYDELPLEASVDIDYFDIDLEKDEKEPPNTTGRNDIKIKNKIKKSPVMLSL